MIEKTEELTYEVRREMNLCHQFSYFLFSQNESLQKSLKEAKNEISIMSSQLTSTSASIVEQEEMVKDAIEKVRSFNQHSSIC